MRHTFRLAVLPWLAMAPGLSRASDIGAQNASNGARVGSMIEALHGSVMIAIFTILIAIHLLSAPIDLLNWPFFPGVMLLVLGVPHGSFDIAILKHRQNLADGRDLAAVLAIYLGLVALVLVSWYFLPSACLVTFLLIAAYHFGADRRLEMNVPTQFVHGAALLAATAIFHRTQVGDIFGWLAPPESAVRLAAVMQAVGPMALAAAGAAILRQSRTVRWPAIEHAVVLSSAVILPPMTFFIVYFCLLHSIRHVIDVRAELQALPFATLLRGAAPYALLAVAASTGGGVLFVKLDAGPALLASIFITLAALTVPHMLLVDLIGPGTPDKIPPAV